MNERCKHIGKDGHRCGSYAFNLYKDDIDQGDLCDVHYWQTKAQSAQEPVAWWNQRKDSVSTDSVHRHNPDCQPLYTTPPQRKPLSAEQVSEICAKWTDENGNTGSFGRRQIARAIEAAHDIRENT